MLPEGTVEAVAFGPTGVLTAESDLELNVSLKGSDDALHTVALAWQPEHQTWRGQLDGELRVVPGPLGFQVARGDVTHSARIAEASFVAPSHEGDVVAVGDLSVELVPKAEGELAAYVVGADGSAIAEGATLKVAAAGAPEPITLAWNAEAGAYVGTLGSSVDLSAEPLRMSVEHEGRIRRGGIAAAAGLRLGTVWRQRIEAGAGGAIPPGQARSLGVRVEVPPAQARGEVEGQAPGVRAAARRASGPRPGLGDGAERSGFGDGHEPHRGGSR